MCQNLLGDFGGCSGGVSVRKEACDQLISEAEQVCQKLGGDLYEVMKKAPLVVEKWKQHYFLAQEMWQHARSREELTAFLLSAPDASPEELETWLTEGGSVRPAEEPAKCRTATAASARRTSEGANAPGMQADLCRDRMAVWPGSGAAGCSEADGPAL
jgi:hypothetical protein